MADDEPSLPLETPKADARRAWRQRVKAVFTDRSKWPGWAAILLVVFEVVPDWKSRFDFWLDVAKSTGGYLAVAATVIASPYFTPALLVAGLAWIAFAGEAPRGVQRHHWLRYVGWSIVSVCVTVVVLTAGYGAITFYIKQQVSQQDTDLQHRYAVRPIYWHLTEAQRTALVVALDEVPEQKRFQIDIQCLPDAGSRTFVEDFAQVLHDHSWKFNVNCLFSRLKPEFTGLSIGLNSPLRAKVEGKPIADWPENLQTIGTILDRAQIPGTWSSFDDDSKDEHFYLLIGNAP